MWKSSEKVSSIDSRGKWRWQIIVVLVLSIIFSLKLQAEEKKPYCQSEDCFPTSVAPFATQMIMTSKARYRYYGFLVFDSALYLTNKDHVKVDFLGKKPSALRLCYHRTMEADDFKRSGSETLALNPTIIMNDLAERVALLHSKYQRVLEGDCYQLSFVPGLGTELSLNDRPIITIPGDDFARAYLGIWLSRYSFSESLTEKLTTPITN